MNANSSKRITNLIKRFTKGQTSVSSERRRKQLHSSCGAECRKLHLFLLLYLLLSTSFTTQSETFSFSCSRIKLAHLFLLHFLLFLFSSLLTAFCFLLCSLLIDCSPSQGASGKLSSLAEAIVNARHYSN